MLLPSRWFRRRATRKAARRDIWTRQRLDRLEERIVPSLRGVFSIPPNPGYQVGDDVSPAIITVLLVDSTRVISPAHQQSVSVQYSVTDGSAVQGTDYQPANDSH